MTDSDASLTSPWVAGVDGFRDGWVAVLWHPETGRVELHAVSNTGALFALPKDPVVVGVDMVIGCPDCVRPGGRPCDREARQLLGHPRGASVFSPPARDALQAESYEEAVQRNRASAPNAPALSKQTYHLIPKMRALAREMTPTRQAWVREIHPELSFYAMNDDSPVELSKHTEAGRTKRCALLAPHGFPNIEERVANRPRESIEVHDVLDAHAACWSAQRIQAGTADRCPPVDDPAPRNDRGLRMEIWR